MKIKFIDKNDQELLKKIWTWRSNSMSKILQHWVHDNFLPLLQFFFKIEIFRGSCLWPWRNAKKLNVTCSTTKAEKFLIQVGSAELCYFWCQKAFKKNQVSKVAIISKLHVQKLFSKTLGTCHARLDTFPRGIWIPSASLSMASFTFKLQHFNVMLSLGLLTHSLSTFGLNQSQGRRNKFERKQGHRQRCWWDPNPTWKCL